ncbi:MAG TPA: ComF family protein [Verrucomicrobiae bacterium]|nr:ComF family protein [Verrucomicrobiae bacterium]
MILKGALGALASVVFASPCRICGEALTNASRIPICEKCLDGFEKIVEPMCAGCGRPFATAGAGAVGSPLCRLCRVGFYGFDRARSFAIYDEALAEAVLLLKYQELARLGDWFAERLAGVVSRMPAEWRADLVVPIPLHADRRRERGYNQAELIARPLADRLGIPFNSRILVRTKPRPAQLVLSRTEHWKSVRGAYAIRPAANVDNVRVLLVDDVLTTGATLDAGARVLKKAGAATVLGLTVGRVRSGLPPPSSVLKRKRPNGKPEGPVEHL